MIFERERYSPDLSQASDYEPRTVCDETNWETKQKCYQHFYFVVDKNNKQIREGDIYT